MDETFDNFQNSSNSSESGIEVIDNFDDDSYDEEVVTVTDEHGSYDEAIVDDRDRYEENYPSNDDLLRGDRNENDAGSNYNNALGSTNDEFHESFLDESMIEEIVEDDDDDGKKEEDPVSSDAINDISSENDSSSDYLSVSDVDSSAAGSSVKYDADDDDASQQASSASSYSAAINDNSRPRGYSSMLGPPRRIKTMEEGSLGISSTSFRSSSYGKELSNGLSTIGDNSIRSTGQPPSPKKSILKSSLSTVRSSTISESEKSNRSESSTMISGTFTNSGRSSNRREKTRKKKTKRPISNQNTPIRSPRENSDERTLESKTSTASSQSAPLPGALGNNEPNRLQQVKQYESTPMSTASTTSSHSVDEIDHGNDKRCASIAVLGTMSGTGKGVIASALCRIFANGGTKCAPFKSQNTGSSTSPALLPDLTGRKILYDSFEAMVKKSVSNESENVGHVSSVTAAPTKEQGYGKIGMAQSMQAEACKIVPRVQMNPMFFKPGGMNEEDEPMCSMVVMGKEIVRETYEDISKRVPLLHRMVLDSHSSLSAVSGAEVIVIQGAGSCTELNLMDGDIVNLPLVRSLQCPWLLVANDETGGVFAQVVGTKMCVSKRDWALCVGVVVNKVRSDVTEFLLGLKMLERMTGKPLYAMPFFDDLNAPNEGAIDIERRLKWEKNDCHQKDYQYDTKILTKTKRNKPSVVVVAYPHTTLSNDLYPLEKDDRFHLQWRRKRLPKPYPNTNTIILPGSRLPMLDLKWLQDTGWADLVRKHVAAGGTVLGLCGGYQMLGWKLKEDTRTRLGIGLLPISSTVLPAECNMTDSLKGQLYPSGVHVEGFEVNCGFSEVVVSEQKNVADGRYKGMAPLVAYENGKPDGMRLGRVQGTYLYGILRSAKARVELLTSDQDREQFHSILAEETTEDSLDKFANHLQTCGLDYNALRKMVFAAESESAT